MSTARWIDGKWLFEPPKEVTYGTWVSPTRCIPLGEHELAAEEASEESQDRE